MLSLTLLMHENTRRYGNLCNRMHSTAQCTAIAEDQLIE